jgi:NADPH:quinone reductase-like Zn-dependent oxidoreductase
MRAIRFHAYKEAPVIEDAPVPKIAPDQVLVRVLAAALNPLDALLVSGLGAKFFSLTFPHTLASDFAGVVERVGSSVTQWKAGDAVIVWSDPTAGGGLAEFAAVPAKACVALPPNMSAAEGAGIPTAGSTAWHALFSSARLQADETVLIHGAAGGVGTFAVQFAAKTGARVIGTASSDGVELVRSLGAHQVIDYKSQDFKSAVSNVDVVLDLVGGDTQARSYDVMRKGGRLVATSLPPDAAVADSRGISASMFYAKPFADRLASVVEAIGAQNVRVVIDRTVPFAAFDEAWARLTSRRARGKVVVAPV